jgi:hypothetical protein
MAANRKTFYGTWKLEKSRRCPLTFEGRGNGFFFSLYILANAEIKAQRHSFN